MKFIVKNLGLIKEAEISPAKITVICGPNNTSKTWLAYAIYGYLQKFPRNFFIEKSASFVCDLVKSEKFDFQEFDLSGGEIDLNDYKHLLSEIIGKLNKWFNAYLPRVFRVSKELLENTEIKVDHDSFNFDFSLPYRRKVRFGRGVGNGGDRRYIIVGVTREANSSILKFKLTLHDYEKLDMSDISERFLRLALDACISAIMPYSFIVTSERAGISIFQKELDINKTEMIEDSFFDDLQDTPDIAKITDETLSRYAMPVRDNIDTIRDYTQNDFYESEFAPEAEEKLAKILGGTFAAAGSNDIAFMIRPADDRRRKIKLPIHFSSSMSKSLLLLDTYVRHLAKRGDILIIDEPELNLHPKNQRKVARFLAWLANKGVKIIITTHSDYIIREFNILGVMHNLPSKQQTSLLKKFEYAKDEMLNLKDDVKIYIVSEKGEVSEAPYAEHGFNVKTFDDSINEMNHIYDTLLDAME